jgi:hypothetical protein
MSDRFEILIAGVDDSVLVTDIERAIRDSLHDMVLPGAWNITVKPSSVSGRWDFIIRSLGVRHALSIAVPPSLLPSLIPRRFRESLDRFCLAPLARAHNPSILEAV